MTDAFEHFGRSTEYLDDKVIGWKPNDNPDNDWSMFNHEPEYVPRIEETVVFADAFVEEDINDLLVIGHEDVQHDPVPANMKHYTRLGSAYLNANENYTSGKLNSSARAAMELKAKRLDLTALVIDSFEGVSESQLREQIHRTLEENGMDVTDRTLDTYLAEYEAHDDRPADEVGAYWTGEQRE